MVEWCGVENSAGKTRGDTRRKNRRERNRDEEGWWERRQVRNAASKCVRGGKRRRRRKRKRKGELLGRNKLARNERQIASELSARSPNVIEVRGPS